MVALGVASFGHINGTHLQNVDQREPYREALGGGQLPLRRAYRPTEEERLIRELVLQLKLGAVRPAYFQVKYRVNILGRFGSQLASLRSEGYLEAATDEIVSLSRQGLLQVDALLPRFFLPQHVGIRYT
ncbi:MAG TPA: hypothetical protein VNN17_08705 [Terriglobia bacterium]|nr:hypothetical protein [Terriglobia bacterium]